MKQRTQSFQDGFLHGGLTLEPSPQNGEVYRLRRTDHETEAIGRLASRAALFGVQVNLDIEALAVVIYGPGPVNNDSSQKNFLQNVPRELLSIEDDLAKGILTRIRVPDLVDNHVLLGAVSNVNLFQSVYQTQSMS